MDLLQGMLFSGAAATGVVVAERIRHRGSGDEVREDVTEFGSTIAHHAGRAAGFVGQTSGKVLGRTAEFAEGMGDRTTRFVSSTGETMARGAGAAMGAYAGAIDKVVPSFGRHHEDEAPSAKKAPSRKAAAKKTTTKTTRAKAS